MRGPEGQDESLRGFRVHLPHQLIIGVVKLQLVNDAGFPPGRKRRTPGPVFVALADRTFCGKINHRVPAPEEQAVAVLQVLQGISRGVQGSLSVFRIARQRAQAVQEPEQVLLAGDVAHDRPLGHVPHGRTVVRQHPGNRFQRVDVDPVSEQGGMLRAVHVPAVCEHVVGKSAENGKVRACRFTTGPSRNGGTVGQGCHESEGDKHVKHTSIMLMAAEFVERARPSYVHKNTVSPLDAFFSRGIIQRSTVTRRQPNALTEGYTYETAGLAWQTLSARRDD